MRLVSLALIPTLALAALTACGGTAAIADEAAAAGTTDMAEPSGDWRVARLDGTAIAADGAPTLSFFEPGRAGGHAGCNRYSATYELDRNGRLAFGPAMATKMACADEGRMQAEIAFLNALAAVRGYRRAGADLHLVDEAGAVLIELAPAAPR